MYSKTINLSIVRYFPGRCFTCILWVCFCLYCNQF